MVSSIYEDTLTVGSETLKSLIMMYRKVYKTVKEKGVFEVVRKPPDDVLQEAHDDDNTLVSGTSANYGTEPSLGNLPSCRNCYRTWRHTARSHPSPVQNKNTRTLRRVREVRRKARGHMKRSLSVNRPEPRRKTTRRNRQSRLSSSNDIIPSQ